MHRLQKLFITLQVLRNDERGQDLIEYALVAALIALAAAAGMQSLGGGISSTFGNVNSALSSAVS